MIIIPRVVVLCSIMLSQYLYDMMKESLNLFRRQAWVEQQFELQQQPNLAISRFLLASERDPIIN